MGHKEGWSAADMAKQWHGDDGDGCCMEDCGRPAADMAKQWHGDDGDGCCMEDCGRPVADMAKQWHGDWEGKKQKVLMLASVASMVDQFNLPNIQLMQQMGYEVHVACNYGQGNTCDRRRIRKLKKELRKMGAIQHQWDCPRSVGPGIRSAWQCLRAYRQLSELFGRYPFAWMHCHSPVGGAIARVAAHRRGISVAYTAHGFHFFRGAPVKNWILYYPIEKALARWTDVLITVNKEDYLFAKKNLGAGKVCYIPGVGIDATRFQEQENKTGTCQGDGRMRMEGQADVRMGFCAEYAIPKDARILLSVGELSRRKNHQAAIAALAEIPREDVYYFICGQGACRRKLLRQAGRLGVAGRVRLTGYQEDVADLYRYADIFVFPSLQEGMPVALMEAMAAGLPCVASDIRGNRELVDASGGRLYAPGCGGQLKKGIMELLEDPHARQKYGSYNRRKIAGYGRKAVQQRMEKIYAKMRQETGGGLRISILVAVYNPNMRWLKQQLASIHRQSFPYYEVLIMDDGSRPAVFGKIREAVAAGFGGQENVFLYRSGQNEGSNRTFEKLTQMAGGDYIAFCDQDDIWEEDKLEKLAAAAGKEGVVLAYSDMSVMDEHGALLYPSLRKMRKWLMYLQGDGLTAEYLSSNCSAGCSMMVRADLAKKAAPFSRWAYCDQWIAAFASAYGKIAFVDMPLVRYRRHGKNQTGPLSGIKGKQDYYARRVLPMYRLVRELQRRGIHFPNEQEIEAFAAARKEKDIRGIWKYRKWNRKYAYFDLFMICMPDALVGLGLHALQKKGARVRERI